MLSPPYWIFAENFPKAGRIGKSFLVLLGCPSGRLPSRRHIEKREDPGDEVVTLCSVTFIALNQQDRFARGIFSQHYGQI